jgi:predicted nucleic acid-binding protein
VALKAFFDTDVLIHPSQRMIRAAGRQRHQHLADASRSPCSLDRRASRGCGAYARDHGFAFYDALIVAAASRSRCSVLYTNEMRDGQAIDGLTIRKPFA